MLIARMLLNLVLIAFIIWAVRRIMARRRQIRDFQSAQRREGAERSGAGGREPIDLVRDEKTGEYRVKDK